MRKSKPVIILLSVQLIIAVALALINPITDYIIRKYGTEYTFATQNAYLTGDFSEYVNITCKLKYGFNDIDFSGIKNVYAIIDTDANALAYLSELSGKKPEDKDYLDVDGFAVETVSYYYSKDIKLDLISTETKEIIMDSLWEGEINLLDGHEVTVSLSVYKGKAVANEFYIDGITAEEYIRNLKGE